jgi:hypothetical protein
MVNTLYLLTSALAAVALARPEEQASAVSAAPAVEQTAERGPGGGRGYGGRGYGGRGYGGRGYGGRG